MNGLLSKANRWLGELNAFGKILPDVDTYIRILTELTGYRRNRIFHFHAYFKLFQS